MERILRRTYGVIVYQEQVIEVAAAVAGFSLAEGDLLRRAMTHERSLEEMDEIGRSFVEKAVARGVERAVADEVFRQLRGFAAYGFNKAHAACFAIVCNASAWLKAHYPAEFYCGLLNNQPMGFYSPRVVLNDARRFGLAVRPLDVNLSGEWFEVEDDGRALRVGLAYVKEMSGAARRAIVEARGGEREGHGRLRVGEGVGGPSPAPACAAPAPMSPSPPHPPSAAASGDAGERPLDATAEKPAGGPPPGGRAGGPARPYTSLADFVARTRVSRGIAENLVRLGAFDALGVRREELVAQAPLLYAGAKPAGRRNGGRGSDGRPRRADEGVRGTSEPAPQAPATVPRSPHQPAAPALDEGLDQPRLALDEQFAPLAFLPDWSRQRRVSVELELLGLNVSAHPLRFVRDQVKALGVTPMARLPQVAHGRRVRLAGVLERAQMPWIRSGHRTMFLTLEDETELGQVVVFNDVYLKYGRVLKDAIYLLVEGELQNDEEHGLAVVAHQIMDLTKVLGSGEVLPAVEPRTRPGRTG
jgi:error-prone DNA polymerase